MRASRHLLEERLGHPIGADAELAELLATLADRLREPGPAALFARLEAEAPDAPSWRAVRESLGSERPWPLDPPEAGGPRARAASS